jgi:decaprenylphospho-beta-D-ribofuranose 2-oxidase
VVEVLVADHDIFLALQRGVEKGTALSASFSTAWVLVHEILNHLISFKHAISGFWLIAIFCIAIALIAPAYHLRPPIETPDIINDAARLNRTRVRKVVHATTEDEIRAAVLEAKARGWKVTIAGKRHSMGGQTLFPDAIVLDMLTFNKILSLDEENKILTLQSGATWNDVQQFLNPHGLAVLAMQGPNVFTVGGSMSVNAHGWDMRHGPVGASVEWFRLLLADGSIQRCSREENSDLFHLVLGGYGLLGVILDVGLRVTDNAGYVADVSEMDFARLPEYFENLVRSHPAVELAEADLSISPGSLLRDSIAIAYTRQAENTNRTDKLWTEEHRLRDGYFFDLSRQYRWGKSLRWALQKRLEYPAANDVRTRNNIFRSPIGRIQYYSPKDTDILQEYFIPPGNFPEFVNGLHDIVEKRHINLLDATVRYIETNNDAFLNYSGRQALSVVLYLNVKTAPPDLVGNSKVTQEIIDLALHCRGTFYLPYVLDYDKSQLSRAYPMAAAFFAAKKKYDPTELFFSQFYSKYAN